MVQPVAQPDSIEVLTRSKVNDEANSHKLILFRRGNAISAEAIRRGVQKLPIPPINAGITMKNIISKACAVITTLNS